MSGRSTDKARVGYHRIENTETVSSPHTFAYNSGAHVPSTSRPDKPRISNIRITSAVAGLPMGQLNSRSCGSATAATTISSSPQRGSREAPTGRDPRLSSSAATTTAPQRMTVDGFPWSTRRVETMTFDMEQVSPPIANLFRRLIMTEVPTIAMDRVLIEENDSVVLDELLSHRLGLVPVAGPVARLSYITQSNEVGFQNLDPSRVLLFELDMIGAPDVAITPVYSHYLRWVPLPGQESWGRHGGAATTGDGAAVDRDLQKNEEETGAERGRSEATGAAAAAAVDSSEEEDDVFLVHPDILLTKLGPGQRLKLRAIAVKGIGAVHAKWSPVSACSYQLKTTIRLTEPICGADAELLMKVCPGVFGLEQSSRGMEAVVVDADKWSSSRESLRKDVYPQLADKIVVEKDKTHVVFRLESVGQLHPAQIFRMALRLFAERIRGLAAQLQSTEVNVTDAGAKSLQQ